MPQPLLFSVSLQAIFQQGILEDKEDWETFIYFEILKKIKFYNIVTKLMLYLKCVHLTNQCLESKDNMVCNCTIQKIYINVLKYIYSLSLFVSPV